MAKVLEGEITRKEKEDEWLPTAIIELRMGHQPAAEMSGHAFVDCLCPTTFLFLLAFVSLEAYVRCNAESNK